MDTSMYDAIAGTGLPLISSPASPPVTLENPSTLELALIGIATIAMFWAVRRLLSLDRQSLTAPSAAAEDGADDLGRRAA